jgi:hypothetical protein
MPVLCFTFKNDINLQGTSAWLKCPPFISRVIVLLVGSGLRHSQLEDYVEFLPRIFPTNSQCSFKYSMYFNAEYNVR